MIDVDDAGSIGRRYRRQDEVGTPFCVTVDFDTLDDRRGDRARPRLDGAGSRADRRRSLDAPPASRLPSTTDDDGRLLRAARRRCRTRRTRRDPRAYRDQARSSTAGRATRPAEVATLNQAWNVLSDPVQRERYDDALAERRVGRGRSTMRARRTTASDDDGVREQRRPRSSTRPTRARRPRRTAGRTPPPTIAVPEGLRHGPTVKPRSSRWSSTCRCCCVIFLVVQFVGVCSSSRTSTRSRPTASTRRSSRSTGRRREERRRGRQGRGGRPAVAGAPGQRQRGRGRRRGSGRPREAR